MEGFRAGIAAGFMAAILLAAAIPTAVAGVQGTWTDTFVDTSRIQSTAGVEVANGSVALDPMAMSRQGLSFGQALGAGSPSVVHQGSAYYLYYAWGAYGSVSVGVATSPDGANWTDHGAVITPGFQGANDSGNVLYEDVIVVGSTFHMWYSGQNTATGLYSLLHATSTNGLSWTGAGTALGPESVGGTYQSVYSPSVYWDGSTYAMWYTTYDGSQTWIRRATSTDGSSWARQGIALAPQAPDDTQGPRMPTVVRASSDFVMWYTCASTVQHICRARSPDGRTWTREGPVLSTDPNLPGESGTVAQPSALETSPDAYRVWYSASGYQPGAIYSALTTDGYASPGYLGSVAISLPTNETWLWLEVDKREPSGTSVRVSVLDANTGSSIPGYSGMTAGNVSLTGIDWRAHPTIQLNATLSSNSYVTPSLDAWSVAYGTPPPPPVDAWSYLLNPLVVVLLVVTVAGVAGYAILRKPGRPNPPAGPGAR